MGAWGRGPGLGSRSLSLNVVLWRGQGWGPEEGDCPALGPVPRSRAASGNTPEPSKGQAILNPQPCLPVRGVHMPHLPASFHGDGLVPRWGHRLPTAPRTSVSPKQTSKPPPSGPGGGTSPSPLHPERGIEGREPCHHYLKT